MRTWSWQRWGIAVGAAVVVALVIGLPTVMIDNPVFSRMVPVEWWNRPIWIVTSALSGMLLATYVTLGRDGAEPVDGPASGLATVAVPVELGHARGTIAVDGIDVDRMLAAGPATPVPGGEVDRTAAEDTTTHRGTIAGLLGYLAVGCPVCNKVVVLALGTSGAMTWFAPLQPVLALASVVLLLVALRSRLQAQQACPTPTADAIRNGIRLRR